MSELSEDIIKLRAEGKSYNEIKNEQDYYFNPPTK